MKFGKVYGFRENDSLKAQAEESEVTADLLTKAEAGDAQSQWRLAVALAQGQKTNYQHSRPWLQKAAEQGHVEAQFNLGLICYNDYLAEGNFEQAAFWYRKAGEQGHADARFNLIEQSSLGRCPPEYAALAATWSEESRIKGDVQSSLGSYVEGCLQDAEEGDADAQYELGDIYYFGEDLDQDYVQAAIWYRKAAEQSHKDATYSLGLLYELGAGVPQDYAQARRWYAQASEQGQTDARYRLGMLYQNGQGMAQNYRAAASLYRDAAEPSDDNWYPRDYQGHADAQFALGFLYEIGQGVPQDYAEAAKWYRKAANQGESSAQYNLGLLYAEGKGVPHDYAEAAKLYSLAASQDDTDAQSALGELYANGQGVAQSYADAYFWLSLAVVSVVAAEADEEDQAEAIKERDAAAEKLSQAELSSTDKRVANWLAEHPRNQ
jgi:TPR repeat protein